MFSRKLGGRRKISFAMCGALLASALAVFGSTAAQAEEEKVLNVYNWSDYIGEDTIAKFEKETGIKVRYDNFDSNETLHAKLVAGKTGYDIVVPSSNWAKIQIEGGLFAKLDRNKIPNMKDLDPWFMQNIGTMDPGNQHLVPWLGGFTTIGMNVDKVKAALGNLPMPENVWDLLFKPEYISKAKSCGVSVLDSGDEVFPAALRYLGKPAYSKNPADYKEAAALLQTIRPSVSLFSSAGYINDLANGSLCLVLGWNGDIAIAAARAKENRTGNNIQPMVPKNGAVLFFDTMAIPADAPHVENAYKWINFVLRPEIQAGMVNKVKYRGPVRAADSLVKPEVSSNKAVFVSPADMAAMVPPEALGNDIRRMRTRLFTTFKTGL